MCKESIRLEILKSLEITKKKLPPALFFYRNRDEKHFVFFYLALHVLGRLQIYQTNPFEALFLYRNIWLFDK